MVFFNFILFAATKAVAILKTLINRSKRVQLHYNQYEYTDGLWRLKINLIRHALF